MVDWRRIRRSAVTVVLFTGRASDAVWSGDAASGARRSGRSVRAKQRPALLVLLLLVFLTGSAAALFANGGYVERKRLEARRDAANVELDRQLRRVHGLRREVDLLARDSLARERLAREELGYTRPGEMIFLLAEPPQSPTKTAP
ncbi:MAG: septum formation initiator family protein [Acidobacteria bacterium]|nr:septum formation initiator family protein [Acidobacteriota bacterium]